LDIKVKKSENSFVIVGRQHNPSVLFGSFFKDSGIIENPNEIDSKNTIISPAFAQVQFKNNDSIRLAPDRLIINGNFGKSPFIKGIKYCKALPHIVYTGIGINFKYKIIGVNLSFFTPKIQKEKYETTGVNLRFNHDHGKCNLKLSEISPTNRSEIVADFNFDYSISENNKIGNLHIDVLEEREKNITHAEEVLHELFN